jgi:transposase
VKQRHQQERDEATEFRSVHPHAAGVDVGASSHFVAVPPGSDAEGRRVREFEAFTCGLRGVGQWLRACGVDTVVMESTGVYWIPLFEFLEAEGFEVLLVDARHVKNVPGRKSDVRDCQWLQELHSYGLLAGAFRPPEQICVLRSYLRQRGMLVQHASQHIQHMQKALTQMNLKLPQVVGDISGVTGMKIIRAILGGERDPHKLAQLRDPRCKHTAAEIAKSLEGSYRAEHLFALRQAVDLYDMYQRKIAECDVQLEAHLKTFDSHSGQTPPSETQARRKAQGNAPQFDLRHALCRILGVDLTEVDGLDAYSVAKVIAEIGTDMSAWPTIKHFISWLGLCPGNKISGGKVLSSRTKLCANKAAAALRIAAQTLYRSHSALGAFLRRMKTRLGPQAAITATAHKLARIIYSLLRDGGRYQDSGEAAYEERFRERMLKSLQRKAKQLGYKLVSIAVETAPTAAGASALAARG